MKNYIIKGLKLLVISSLYILLSFIHYNLSCDEILGVFVGLGFFALWFYFGYHYSLGFKGGLFIGMIGALFGICSALLSLSQIILNPANSLPTWCMIHWSMPFSSLFCFIPDNIFPGDSIIFITIPLVILLTALGGYISKKRTASN